MITQITYEGILNTSDLVCGRCVRRARRISKIILWLVHVTCLTSMIAVVAGQWERIDSVWKAVGMIVGLGFLLPGLFTLIAWMKHKDWFGNHVAVAANKRKLKKHGYRYFGADHLEGDTAEDLLRKIRNLN